MYIREKVRTFEGVSIERIFNNTHYVVSWKIYECFLCKICFLLNIAQDRDCELARLCVSFKTQQSCNIKLWLSILMATCSCILFLSFSSWMQSPPCVCVMLLSFGERYTVRNMVPWPVHSEPSVSTSKEYSTPVLWHRLNNVLLNNFIPINGYPFFSECLWAVNDDLHSIWIVIAK